MGFHAVRFCIARSELNSALSGTKGFRIPLQFHEGRALIYIVSGMRRSPQDCSFKGIQGLFVVTGGREDQSDAIVGCCMRGIEFKRMLKGHQRFERTIEAMEGETLAGVRLRIGGMQVNLKLPGISCFGESVKGFLVAPELQERKALTVVHSSGARVKEQRVYIGFKGIFIPFHLVVSLAICKPLLFCPLKEVRHTAMRIDRVTSVPHRIILCLA